MRLRLFLVSVACALATLFPAAASAQPRMLIGFQDDPSLAGGTTASPSGISLSRRTPESRARPSTGRASPRPGPRTRANPFDPAYRFDDLDEFVRNAGLHGMEVMLTIWGTPQWANGGKGQNYAPTKIDRHAELRARRSRPATRAGTTATRSSATTRSGTSRTSASSSRRSTTPRASRSRRRSTRSSSAPPTPGSRPATRARSSASARPRRAAVTATSAGRARRRPSRPGKFAQLLSQQKPLLRFDAWSHHPYPTSINGKPISERPLAERHARRRCRGSRSRSRSGSSRRTSRSGSRSTATRRSPRSRRASRYAQQAAYVRQAITYAAKDPNASRSSSGSSSGTTRRAPGRAASSSATGAKKPSFTASSRVAKPYDGRNPQIFVRAGVKNPLVKFAALELWSRSGAGAKVGMTIADLRQAARC